eukprot:CAMPEP_0196786474 /NCGR_PEP_ID=MMETSP1104-20130614/21418_1 /TAXON_ID=33652 /ORGANISM="Cafeteria sp., Strain Caron Lab Isolate" /LENGTH=52 /DNA_ID=CAMNT_0042156795 /DNA_START=40 /DNA_END=195 /DNA_ORIENTATION=+
MNGSRRMTRSAVAAAAVQGKHTHQQRQRHHEQQQVEKPVRDLVRARARVAGA